MDCVFEKYLRIFDRSSIYIYIQLLTVTSKLTQDLHVFENDT